MSPVHNAHDKTCPGCGLIFRWRNDLDTAWSDKRYCSSRCQRQAGLSGTSTKGRARRPTQFPGDTRRMDGGG